MPIMIGRGAGCNIVLDDHEVSRNHCQVGIENDAPFFRDQGSRNSTLHNAAPSDGASLNRGDKLAIGSTIFQVCSTPSVGTDRKKGPGESTLHIVGEENNAYLQGNGDYVPEGNPHTVSDLYWLFTASRRLSEPQVREQFVATLVEIVEERLEPDGILIQGLPYTQGGGRLIHSYGNLLEQADAERRGIGDADGQEPGGKLLSTVLDGQRLCSMMSTITIGSEYIGSLMVQRVKDSDAYFNEDLEALVALCRSIGPLYQSVCAVERMVVQFAQVREEYMGDVSLIGESPEFETVRTAIAAANRGNMPVLIQGETGVGKELVARCIHARSDRAAKPFVTVDCSVIPDESFDAELFGQSKGANSVDDPDRFGRLRASDGGTLFLDDVGTLSLENQSKLVRILDGDSFSPVGSIESVRVDVRIMADCTKRLSDGVAAGVFRQDLYHRLCGIQIDIPPLRDRGSDIALLAEHFMAESCFGLNEPSKTFSTGALELLEQWTWPGNVRELRMCIDRAAAYSHSTIVRPREIILHDSEDTETPAKSLADMERVHIINLLENKAGNISATAKELGISRTTLYHKLDAYGLRD